MLLSRNEVAGFGWLNKTTTERNKPEKWKTAWPLLSLETGLRWRIIIPTEDEDVYNYKKKYEKLYLSSWHNLPPLKYAKPIIAVFIYAVCLGRKGNVS